MRLRSAEPPHLLAICELIVEPPKGALEGSIDPGGNVAHYRRGSEEFERGLCASTRNAA